MLISIILVVKKLYITFNLVIFFFFRVFSALFSNFGTLQNFPKSGNLQLADTLHRRCPLIGENIVITILILKANFFW